MDEDDKIVEPVVTGAPESIWLCYGDLTDCPPGDPNTHAYLSQTGDFPTWCDEQIDSSDVAYIRADLAQKAGEEMQKDAMRWRYMARHLYPTIIRCPESQVVKGGMSLTIPIFDHRDGTLTQVIDRLIELRESLK